LNSEDQYNIAIIAYLGTSIAYFLSSSASQSCNNVLRSLSL